MENVSDAAAFNSTVVLPTNSKQSVSAEIVATVALILQCVGVCANGFVLVLMIRAHRHFGSAVHILITNQSAMDLFACVFGMCSYIMLLTGVFKYVLHNNYGCP